MSKSKVNVGVIGVGCWGSKILDEYSRIDEAAIEGVADLDKTNLRFCAEKYGVTNGFIDYRHLLSCPALDAVSVCVPNSQHYRVTRDALDAGKHVLVEKPLTLNSQEASELVEVAKRNNLTLGVGHIFRFNNALMESRRLINEKDYFGKLCMMEMNWGNREALFPDRDVIWDEGPHIFDIQNYLTDEWPIELNCMAGTFRREVGEDGAYIGTRFRDNTIAMSSISWLSACKMRHIYLTGEIRSARIDAVGQKLTIFEGNSPKEIAIQPNNTIRDELVHFVESIVKPDHQMVNCASIGVKAVELIEAAKKSIVEGKTIRLVSIENQDTDLGRSPGV